MPAHLTNYRTAVRSRILCLWLLMFGVESIAQGVSEVVWVDVAEARLAQQLTAAKRLFTRADIDQRRAQKVFITRLQIEPVVIELKRNERFCIRSLQARAIGPSGAEVAAAPVVISVREDQQPQLRLNVSAGDLCIQPAAAGEFPIRFSSLLPAPDQTTRGAQIFVRVSDK